MNLIYSFKKFNHSHYKPIDSTFFNIAKTSVDMARKHYTTILYCDSASKKMFETNGVIFDKIIICDSIENYSGRLIGMIKILAMMEQTEPYIISDFDTIIFKKPIQKNTIDFAYPELKNITDDTDWNSYDEDKYLYRLYKKPFDKYHSKFSEYYNHGWDIPSNISNHSLVMVSHPILVKEIYHEVLSILSVKEQEDCYSPFLEQFLLTYYLTFMKVDYGYIHDSPPTHNDLSIKLLKWDFIHLINYDTDITINNKIEFITNKFLK